MPPMFPYPTFLLAVAIFQLRVVLSAHLGTGRNILLRSEDSQEGASRNRFTNQRLTNESLAPQVLVIFAANSKPESIAQVVKNVDHFRQSGVQFEVAIFHYDEKESAWRDPNQLPLLMKLTQDQQTAWLNNWYPTNVNYSLNSKGWKFRLAKEFASDHNVSLAKYPYVWLLDQDIDTTTLDLNVLLEEVVASESLIASPSFHQVNGFTGELEKPLYKFSIPEPRCRYRNTRLIEIMQPLFRGDVLDAFLECKDCMAPHMDWGIDRAWCSWTASHFKVPITKACAVLDRVHSLHRSTSETGGLMQVWRDEGGRKANAFVRKHNAEHYIKWTRVHDVLGCMCNDGSPATEIKKNPDKYKLNHIVPLGPTPTANGWCCKMDGADDCKR